MKEYKSAIPELSLKYKKSNIPKIKITNDIDSYKYVSQFYFDDINIYESFFIVLLNRANNTTGYVKISQGGTAGTIVDIKIICKYAIESLCHGIIMCHNHPSGNIKPSQEDIKLTHQIKKALEIFNIHLIDHIIISEKKYYSFSKEGLI